MSSETRTQEFAPSDCPVGRILGVWRFERGPYFRGRAFSTPGHLLHLVAKGSWRVRVGGIDYEAGAGDIIYYFESEEVESFCGPDGVEFYSAAFSGQRLRPFPPGRRVLPSNAAARRAFESLYKASLMPESAERTLRVFSGLLMALAEIGLLTQTGTQNPSGKLWSDIEAKLRERKLFRPSMGDLCRISGKSRSAVARACAEVSGASPLRRVRETRMAEAAGLLRHTDMSVSDVAAYLGYPRMHEFSREFSGHFGHPPTALRKKV